MAKSKIVQTANNTPTPSPSGASNYWSAPWFGMAISALAAMIAYAVAIQQGFVFFDDDKAILYNQSVLNPSLKGFFTGQNLGMYAPFTWIAYWLGSLISGQEAWGYHLLSVLLHTINAAVLYTLLHRLLGRQWPALFASLLFAVHPIQAEAVSWAAALSTVLFSNFYLLGILAYVKWQHKHQFLWYTASFALFLMAVLSKSAAVTFPLLLFAVDFLLNKKTDGKFWLSKIPFLLISFVFGVKTFLTRAAEGHDIEASSSVYSALDRFFMSCQTLLFYPFKLLAPLGFSVAYPFEKTNGAWSWYYYAAPLAILAMAYLVWKYWRSQREYLFAIGFYLLPLLVMLPIRTVGSFELRSDRYVYLSSVGVFLLLGLLLEKQGKEIRMGILAISTAVLALLSYQQAQVWKDGVALFSNCVKKTPQSALCQCNLAYNELVRSEFPKSIEHYSNTLELDTTYIEAYNGRGQAYLMTQQVQQAYSDFDKAILYGLSSPKLFLNRGKCLVMLNQPEKAISDLEKSLVLEPRAPEAWFFKGFALEKTQRPEQAIIDYGKAIEQDPRYLEPLVNRGLLLSKSAQYEAAVADYNHALELNPNLGMALNNRAYANLMLGNTAEALIDLNKAIELNPTYINAYLTRIQVYSRLGDQAKANADNNMVNQLRQQGR